MSKKDDTKAGILKVMEIAILMKMAVITFLKRVINRITPKNMSPRVAAALTKLTEVHLGSLRLAA